MNESQELTVIDVTSQLTVARPPEVVLMEAQKAAAALKDVISKKAKPVIMNGEQYLEFEDWQTLARFYGLTAKVKATEFIEWGTVKGFNATAVVLRSDGMEITAAEGMCLNDEPKWHSRPVYEWRDKEGGGGREKVKVSEEPVPLFQLKSMAQTRACAKALRNVLSWVVVLAGYKATPAEEMTGQEEHGSTSTPTLSVRPDGVTKVADVKDHPGKPPAKWTRYEVIFEDGRRASTFDDKIAAQAKGLKGGKDIVPTIEPGKKEGTLDLKGFEEPPKPPEPEAPQVPETVLVTRSTKRGDKVWWVIQGSEKEYLTDDEGFAQFADMIKTDKLKVLFTWEKVTTPKGYARKITKIENVDPDETQTDVPG